MTKLDFLFALGMFLFVAGIIFGLIKWLDREDEKDEYDDEWPGKGGLNA